MSVPSAVVARPSDSSGAKCGARACFFSSPLVILLSWRPVQGVHLHGVVVPAGLAVSDRPRHRYEAVHLGGIAVAQLDAAALDLDHRNGARAERFHVVRFVAEHLVPYVFVNEALRSLPVELRPVPGLGVGKS